MFCCSSKSSTLIRESKLSILPQVIEIALRPYVNQEIDAKKCVQKEIQDNQIDAGHGNLDQGRIQEFKKPLEQHEVILLDENNLELTQKRTIPAVFRKIGKISADLFDKEALYSVQNSTGSLEFEIENQITDNLTSNQVEIIEAPSRPTEHSILANKFSRNMIEGRFKEATIILDQIEQIDYPDCNGHSPLQISIICAKRSCDAQQIAKKLILMRANIRQNQLLLRDCIFRRNHVLTEILFWRQAEVKRKKLEIILEKVSEFLLSIPDFSLCLALSMGSRIPLVSLLSPDDNLIIRKQGSTFRIDYSLVGYSFPLSKRRKMTCYFDGEILWSINHIHAIYTNCLEALNGEELIALTLDLLKLGSPPDPMSLHISSVRLQKASGYFTSSVEKKISGLLAKKYFLNFQYAQITEQPERNELKLMFNSITDWEKYVELSGKIDKLEKDKQSCISIIKEPAKRSKSLDTSLQHKKENKFLSVEVWLTYCPLQLHYLLPIFHLFGCINPYAAKIHDFFSKGLKEMKVKFPIRSEIPLDYTLFLLIQFKDILVKNFRQQLTIPKGRRLSKVLKTAEKMAKQSSVGSSKTVDPTKSQYNRFHSPFYGSQGVETQMENLVVDNFQMDDESQPSVLCHLCPDYTYVDRPTYQKTINSPQKRKLLLMLYGGSWN